MVDVGVLRGLDRTTLTVRTSDPSGWLPLFPTAHLAEHLIGRGLDERCRVTGLTGHIQRGVITVRFLAAPGQPDPLCTDELVSLRDTSSEVFEQEVRVLAAEDEILPGPLRSAGRLPGRLADFRRSWQDARPVPVLCREPYPGGDLAQQVHVPAPRPPSVAGTVSARTLHGGAVSGRTVEEYDAAYVSLRRRLGGGEPELFLDGGPVRHYYGPASVFLAGLCAYRSPLFQALRRGDRPVYCFRLFDFPWRRRSFVACATQPAVGGTAFAGGIGRQMARIVAELDTADLSTVLVEGTVRVLDDLAELYRCPRRYAGLRLVAKLNGFSPDLADVVRPVLSCEVADLSGYRDTFLDSLRRHLYHTAREGR